MEAEEQQTPYNMSGLYWAISFKAGSVNLAIADENAMYCFIIVLHESSTNKTHGGVNIS